ncbi:hypothetical protein [Burkholderia cepacia]|uniref:hypothetical protein n=1 Tax=Burkholderia cepacia TaxID=292 RepID=UPI0012D32E69|nr:hypothetical protein [Burkholderia cepacia]
MSGRFLWRTAIRRRADSSMPHPGNEHGPTMAIVTAPSRHRGRRPPRVPHAFRGVALSCPGSRPGKPACLDAGFVGHHIADRDTAIWHSPFVAESNSSSDNICRNYDMHMNVKRSSNHDGVC